MKKVLSIDLDYIMGPSNFMFGSIGWHPHPFIRWDLFYKLSDLKKEDLIYDDAKLNFVKKIFLKSLQTCKSVSFGYEHDSILYSIKDFESIDLVNIDHHDDVLMYDYNYFNTAIENYKSEHFHVQKYNKVDEGCWIGWLNQQNKLNSLIWVGNEDSITDHKQEFIKSILGKYDFITRCDELESLSDSREFDHIFVCLSPQYIPPHHWNVMNWFIETYEEYSGNKVNLKECDSKKFEIFYRYKEVSDLILNNTANEWKPIFN